MKISFKELRKTPFEVKASVKNLKKTYKIQLKLAKLQEMFSEDVSDKVDQEVEKTDEEQLKEEIAKNQRNITKTEKAMEGLDSVTEYVVDMLKLKESEADKLEELSQEEVMAIAQRLNMRLMGMTEAEIEETLAESDEDEGLE
ncbi:phage tail tube assembly chaperone [Weissella confusa]|uniref:phage tail tube assembly chaperone n=1 Tax=Weissella confusa TaxID=1583 RepID=UPI0022E8BC25|nr:phage tail tube assembly chaperone [Weissella confusa]